MVEVGDYAKRIKQAREEGLSEFTAWFNKPKEPNKTFEEAELNFKNYILTPIVENLLGDTQEKVALEIGYGGGRLMNAGCTRFKKVIGIDVHNEASTVAKILNEHGHQNFELKQGIGTTIDVDSESIDFIYTFIVFQHLPTFKAFNDYISEIHRCLKLGGIAQVFYGSFYNLSFFNKVRYYRHTYVEINAPVNHTSLVIKDALAIKTAEKCGFRVCDIGISYKTYPTIRGGQEYMTLKKGYYD